MSVLLNTTLYWSSLPDLKGGVFSCVLYESNNFATTGEVIIEGACPNILLLSPDSSILRLSSDLLWKYDSTYNLQTKAGTNSELVKMPIKKTTPTGSKATHPEVSVSGGEMEESEVDSVTGPSCFLCEGPCDISFQPCGHTAMCAECVQSVSVKRCPTCRVSYIYNTHDSQWRKLNLSFSEWCTAGNQDLILK